MTPNYILKNNKIDDIKKIDFFFFYNIVKNSQNLYKNTYYEEKK